jgi:hypothetical protein
VVGIVGTLALFGAIIGSASCAGTIDGQVLDAHTAKPVPGAVVLGVWMFAEGAPGLVHSELVGVQESETDAEGRFTLDNLGGPKSEARITVYKADYLAWSNLFTFPPLRRRAIPAPAGVIKLEPCPAEQDPVDHRLFIDLARSAGLYGNDRDPQFQAAITRGCTESGGVRQ